LTDSVFFATKNESTCARIFEGIADEPANIDKDEHRQGERLKAEMLLLHAKPDATIAMLAELLGEVPPSPLHSDSVMSQSTGSLMPGETYASTEDEGEAQTPDMVAADEIVAGQVEGKVAVGQVGVLPPSTSMML
jgi:hypothetical protein